MKAGDWVEVIDKGENLEVVALQHLGLPVQQLPRFIQIDREYEIDSVVLKNARPDRFTLKKRLRLVSDFQAKVAKINGVIK